jgi:hypothetical protein
MSGVIVIVGFNGADYKLILKNNYKVFSVTSDFLNQIHATQKLFRPWNQDEYKISDCDIKDKTMVHIRPVLWPACRSATPSLTIHPMLCSGETMIGLSRKKLKINKESHILSTFIVWFIWVLWLTGFFCVRPKICLHFILWNSGWMLETKFILHKTGLKQNEKLWWC